MKKVICFGTFDLLHPGHLDYFKQAKKYGDFLIVIIARDKNIKKKDKIFSEQERLSLANNLKVVDKAVLGDLKDFLKPIKNLNQKSSVLVMIIPYK